MSGLIALLGSGAYLDMMTEVDRWLLAQTGRHQPRVVCVPTAAVPFGQRKLQHYSHLALDHFRRFGVPVEIAAITNRFEAYRPDQIELVTCNVNSATHLLRESTAHATVDP
jgi:peptidase E